MGTIGKRVRNAIQEAELRQKEVAEHVGMTPDSLSRALSGQRGFAAIELADIARVLNTDLHHLITGEPEPARLKLSARHVYNHETHERTVDDIDDDQSVIDAIELAYAQAGDIPQSPNLPRSAGEAKALLGNDLASRFVDKLEYNGIDVVCVEDLSHAYSFTISGRHIIAISASGNWFYENWSLAHELGHLCLGHEGILPGSNSQSAAEREANAFAAELLLPEQDMRRLDWQSVTPVQLAHLLWTHGVSTGALRTRLTKLDITPSDTINTILQGSTQRVLRRHWSHSDMPTGDPITERMTAASARRFPAWLKEAHLKRIAEGAVRKHTLAWILDVDPDALEVEEPPLLEPLGANELAELLG